MLIIEILIIAIILFGLFLITSHIFFNKIYLPYKQISQPMTATELFDTLSSMINTECPRSIKAFNELINL